MNPYESINSVKDDQISELDLSGDLTRKRGTKEWKENREDFLKDVKRCEWCGDEPESFDIHHTWSRDLGRKWIRASDIAFVKSEEYDSSLTKDREECPDCGKRDYYERKTKEPKYRCSNCSLEFSSPTQISGKESIKNSDIATKPYLEDEYEYMKQKAEWIEQNPSKVKDEFEKLYQEILQEYVDIREDQVVAICSSCHYKEEKTNLRRCRDCGENWHQRSNYKCWDCIVEEEGLKQCSDCDDGWYSPDNYDACSSCR
jgi:ribosomal protein L37AE/L43A